MSSPPKVAAPKLSCAIIDLSHLSYKSLARLLLLTASPLRGLATVTDCNAKTIFGTQPTLSFISESTTSNQ